MTRLIVHDSYYNVFDQAVQLTRGRMPRFNRILTFGVSARQENSRRMHSKGSKAVFARHLGEKAKMENAAGNGRTACDIFLSFRRARKRGAFLLLHGTERRTAGLQGNEKISMLFGLPRPINPADSIFCPNRRAVCPASPANC